MNGAGALPAPFLIDVARCPMEKRAMEAQRALMQELGLAQPLIAWHTIRDTIAEVGCVLGLVGGIRARPRLRYLSRSDPPEAPAARSAR